MESSGSGSMVCRTVSCNRSPGFMILSSHYHMWRTAVFTSKYPVTFITTALLHSFPAHICIFLQCSAGTSHIHPAVHRSPHTLTCWMVKLLCEFICLNTVPVFKIQLCCTVKHSPSPVFSPSSNCCDAATYDKFNKPGSKQVLNIIMDRTLHLQKLPVRSYSRIHIYRVQSYSWK